VLERSQAERVVKAVLTATPRSYGKGQISTPYEMVVAELNGVVTVVAVS